MPIIDLPLDQKNIIITRSKEGILDIKKIFISKGANVLIYLQLVFLILMI